MLFTYPVNDASAFILMTTYSFAATNCVPKVTVLVAFKLLSKLPARHPALSPTWPVEKAVAKSIQPVACPPGVVGNFKNTFIYAVILLIFGGFIKYFSEKRVEYAKNWSTFNFIFGVNKCKSLENI